MATQDISQLVVEVQSKGIQTATNQLDKLATASDKAEKAVKKLTDLVTVSNGAMSGGVVQAAALVAAMTTLTAVLDRMSQTQTRTTTTTRANNEAMREAHALARGLSGSLGALWVTYGNLAGMGVGIALGASLKGVVTVGMEVEQTLEQIRVLGQATTGDIEKMGQAISEIGKGTQGPKQVAEALQVLTLAGLNAQQALSGVQAALDLSVAGGVGIEKSAETLVQVSTALGYTANDFAHVGDVVAKTAAVSMSSVDSISNAFKSAAAVGEVYGASLQDIALGLAAVANLGIQGTSAGTALKNFYKDLSASTQKVTSTLRAMKLSISDFRDSQGFMLPLIDVVKKLDQGFNSLDQKQKKLAEVKMFSQQGAREYAVLNKLLHTTSEEVDILTGKLYTSKLDEMFGEINKAAGFATLAAIAMAQTTQNQFKAVGNTLQTTFLEVFKEIQPEIGEVARALKKAFGSDEFKSSLKAIATSIADITKFVVENTGAVLQLAAAWWGALRLAALVPTLNAAVTAAGGIFAAMRAAATGMSLASVAATGLNAALGPIGITIAALTAAWVLYKSKQDDALNNTTATNALQEYTDGVIKAAEKEQLIKQMRKEGKTQADIDRAVQMKQDKDAADLAIRNSQNGVNAMKEELATREKSLSFGERFMLQRMKEGGNVEYVTSRMQEYIDKENKYNKALEVHAANVNNARYATEQFMKLRDENSKAGDAQSKANRFISAGDGQLETKLDSKALNDAYNRDIKIQMDAIKAARQQLENFRESEKAAFDAGQIGRVQVINQTADAEIEAYTKMAEAARNAQARAEKMPNHEADVERFRAEAERFDQDVVQSKKMRDANLIVNERATQAQITNMKVKALEEQGKFREAADLKWSAEGKIALEQAQKDLEAYGSKFPWLADLVKQYAANRDAAMNSAQLKEDVIAFDTAMLQVEQTLKGFKSATFGGSVDTVLSAAAEATDRFNVALENARAKRDALLVDTIASNYSPESMKRYEEANKELLAIGDKHKTMWKEVGETITDSLTQAFGKSGAALGDLNKAMIAYNQSENATASDRMKQYGDMAQAASGFFDSQSKGYKVLNGIAQVFHVAQMARTMVQTAASVAAGAAQMFAQSGWGGFAGVAAMSAVMAGLGWAMSGASSHGADPKLDKEYVQKHQGTGSVFGDADAKSETISKLMDSLKSNSDMMLPLTSAMLSSLKNIEASMAGLAKLAIQNGVTDGSNFNVQTGLLSQNGSKAAGALLGGGVGYMAGAGLSAFTAMGSIGGPIGMVVGALVGAVVSKLWGKTTQEITDSGLQFGGKVSDLQAGKGVDQYAAVKTTKSSWFGLSKSSSTNVLTGDAGSEINDQFGKIFTSLQTSLESAAGSLGTTSKAVGDAIDNVVLSTRKISLKDLKGDELTKAINSVISEAMDTIAKAAYPDMQAFQQVGEGYAQTVIRVASGVEQANVALEKLGIAAINYMSIANKTGDVAYEIAKQSILLKEGASGVGDIMKNISGSISDITSAYSELVAARKKMDDVGLGLGLSFDTLKGAGDLKTLNAALGNFYEKYFTDAEKVAIETQNMTEQFAAAGATMPKSRQELRTWIEAAAKAGDQLKVGKLLALASGFDTLESAIEKLYGSKELFSDDAVSAAKDAYDKALDAAEAAYGRLETSIGKEKDKIKTRVDALKNVLTSLSDALKATAPKESQITAFKKAMSVIGNAVSTVNGGGDISGVSGLEDAIKEVSSQSDDAYETALDYKRAQAEANASLSALEQAGNSQVDIYEKQLAKLDEQLDMARAQLDALKGIDNSVLTVAAALANFGSALSAAQVAGSNYQAVQAGADGGMSAAVESLYKNILHRASDEAGKAYWMDVLSKGGVTMSQVTQSFYDSDEFKSMPKFDVGTNNVPEDMVAMVHKGERIIPAADNAALEKRLKDADEAESQGASSSEINAKLAELILAIQQGDVANVQKTNELLKIIRDWDRTGQPPVRSDT